MEPVVLLSQVDKNDIPQVGGKAANLGEMIKAGLPVPTGFVVTAAAYDQFLDASGLRKKVFPLLKDLDVEDTKKLQATAVKIEKLIMAASWPPKLKAKIEEMYEKIGQGLVAARSSATAEDLPGASFAGQQATYLNISGNAALLNAVKRCIASLFGARAIYYRKQQGFKDEDVKIAVPVQRMVESEVSGIMFTADPTTSNLESIVIEAGYGLGEAIVSGSVTPDTYEVNKKTLEITKKEINSQPWAIVYEKSSRTNKHKTVPKAEQKLQKLPDEFIKKLAALGRQIETHYGKPQDTEWAKVGDKLFMIQARPITTLKSSPTPAQSAAANKEEGQSADGAEIILRGAAASLGLTSGPVRIIHKPTEISRVLEGDILVTEMTTPDYVPAMKRAVAIVTDTGGKTSHAAIVSRELGVPCVVGTGTATAVLKEGMIVTVDGNKGVVYKGKVSAPAEAAQTAADSNPEAFSAGFIPTATKVYVNVAEPDVAEKIASQPIDGVGLLRAEFILSDIGEHPKAMLKAGKGKEFTQHLANGIERICRTFFPRPVVYRATDFKTNEYKNLKGGAEFEPDEANPMIGYRGAYRYIKEPEVFDLEVDAILEVRNRELNNLHVMVPFVRSVPEYLAVKEHLERRGLVRSKDFKLWIMVEVPATVILLEEFIAAGIDGVSIGTNDLTQLTLGLDRDNPALAESFDERNPAVVKEITYTVRTCRKHHVTVSVCGQAPSIYPEITELLVRHGATSVSVTPDMIIPTRKLIASVEKRIMLDKELGIGGDEY